MSLWRKMELNISSLHHIIQSLTVKQNELFKHLKAVWRWEGWRKRIYKLSWVDSYCTTERHPQLLLVWPLQNFSWKEDCEHGLIYWDQVLWWEWVIIKRQVNSMLIWMHSLEVSKLGSLYLWKMWKGNPSSYQQLSQKSNALNASKAAEDMQIKSGEESSKNWTNRVCRLLKWRNFRWNPRSWIWASGWTCNRSFIIYIFA